MSSDMKLTAAQIDAACARYSAHTEALLTTIEAGQGRTESEMAVAGYLNGIRRFVSNSNIGDRRFGYEIMQMQADMIATEVLDHPIVAAAFSDWFKAYFKRRRP